MTVTRSAMVATGDLGLDGDGVLDGAGAGGGLEVVHVLLGLGRGGDIAGRGHGRRSSRNVVELCDVSSSAMTPPTTVTTAISQDHLRTRRM